MILDTRGQPFDLDLTLSAGQAFRWKREADGWWSGIVCGRLVIIRQADGKDGEVEFNCISGREAEVASLLNRYFRLGDPIADIYKEISRCVSMGHLVKRYNGLRLLRQEPWECLISYICSATNSVERISQSVENLSALSKRKLRLDGWVRYDFPTPEELAEAQPEELSSMIQGIPALAGRLKSAATKVQGGRLNLMALRKNPSCYLAVRALESLEGVGDKISDCVALFSLDKLEAFPVDRQHPQLACRNCTSKGIQV